MVSKMREMCLDLLAFRNKYSKEQKEFEKLLEAWLKLEKGNNTLLVNWDIEATDGRIYIALDYVAYADDEHRVVKRYDFECAEFEDFFKVNWLKKWVAKQELDKKKQELNKKKVAQEKKHKQENEKLARLEHLHRQAEELGYTVCPI